jgi:hypothetical protein
VLCVDTNVNEWWNDVWGASTVLRPTAECAANDEPEFNYGLTVVDAPVTEAYCAGTCDAVCDEGGPVEPQNGCPSDCQGCFDGDTCTTTAEWWTCGEAQVCGWAEVHLQVDMNSYDPNKAPHFHGTMNGWCGDCGNLGQDTDVDGIYTWTQYLSPQTWEWKPSVDAWGVTSEAPAACSLDPQYKNYHFDVSESDVNSGVPVVVGPVCFQSPIGTCAACDAEPESAVCANAPGRAEPVTVDGYNIVVGGVKTYMKGVAWSPTPKGAGPGASDYATFVAQDAGLMQAAGINVVRTYGPIIDTVILDTLYDHGIHVLMTIYYGYSETPASAVDTLCQVKSHPAIIGWAVGNEWNYNNLGLGGEISFEESVQRVKDTVDALKLNDTTRPVSTVYGGVPSGEVYDWLANVDFWGLNIYSGESFGGLFSEWSELSDKPMYFGEYGADAYDGTAGAEDQATQATILQAQTQEAYDSASVTGGVCAGGMVFEWNDEWWKSDDGGWDEHDTTASWQNGAYPDPTIQEEWWGLVDIDRNVRQAYTAYAGMPAPEAP